MPGATIIIIFVRFANDRKRKESRDLESTSPIWSFLNLNNLSWTLKLLKIYICLFSSSWCMLIRLCEAQKTVAISFPADGKVFVFFEAGLPEEMPCFECSLVSAAYQFRLFISNLRRRLRNDAETFSCCWSPNFAYCPECHSTPQQFSLVQYFMQE